jgi:5-methyltetrahydrofolate--homocysteine methyltransferase
MESGMIIIGERINATRKKIGKAIQERDRQAIEKQIRSQGESGADYIDLNAGTGVGGVEGEIEALCWLIDIALEVSEKGLSLDSSSPEVIGKAAAHLAGRRPWILNSVKDDGALEELLAIAAREKALVIALAMAGEAVPEDAAGRLAVCRSIHSRVNRAGLAEDRILFDPLVLPVAADGRNGRVALETLAAVKSEFPGARTSMGISNISYGLPKRARINAAMLVSALSLGLDAAICDPTSDRINRAIALGWLLSGRDEYCRAYTTAARAGLFDPKPEGR